MNLTGTLNRRVHVAVLNDNIENVATSRQHGKIVTCVLTYISCWSCACGGGWRNYPVLLNKINHFLIISLKDSMLFQNGPSHDQLAPGLTHSSNTSSTWDASMHVFNMSNQCWQLCLALDSNASWRLLFSGNHWNPIGPSWAFSIHCSSSCLAWIHGFHWCRHSRRYPPRAHR